MKNKTLWIGFIATFVVMQVFNFLVHGVLMAESYEALGTVFRSKEQMDSMMWIMIASGAAALFLFCYIFTKGHEGKGIGEGVRYGLLMGLFLAFPVAIDVYVIYPVPLNMALLWFGSTVVAFMLVGGVFSALYKPLS